MKRYSWVLLVVAAVLVNQPIVHAAWVHEQIERNGVDVTLTEVRANAPGQLGELASHESVPDQRLLVVFRLPEDVDPDRVARTHEVDEPAWNEALETGELGARVIAGDPPRYHLDGQVNHHTRLLIRTLAADLVLVVLFLLGLRAGIWRRRRLEAVAVGHVERVGSGMALEKLDHGEFVLRGTVLGLSPGRVLLDLGDRTVDVQLDGHDVPVQVHQTAQVRARLV